MENIRVLYDSVKEKKDLGGEQNSRLGNTIF
jgi:hypothetical protein